MKKAIFIIAILAIFTGAVCYAGLSMSASPLCMSGGVYQSKTFDLGRANAQCNIVFSAYSCKAIIYGKWASAGGTLYRLGSYSTAGTRSYSKLNITTPYRYVMVRYTSLAVASGAVGHTCPAEVFSW